MGISDVGDEAEGLDEAVARHPAGMKDIFLGKTPEGFYMHGHENDPGIKIQGTKDIEVTNTTLQKYADSSMFEAAPQTGKEPEVYLLWMTPDPLGAVAAACRMYEGKPTYNLSEITDDERRKYWEAMQDTALNAPLEVIKMHFFIENVDRAFTHQLVRQRTAVYFQESLRFAVKESLADEVSYPPSLQDGHHKFDNQSGLNDARDHWKAALVTVEEHYKWLIANGVPAEDARGLLPTAVPTRIHYVTDLRNMLDHAGNRLCTQAQFHWRLVFTKIREAIRTYWEYGTVRSNEIDDGWQFKLITDTSFVPKCYQQGKCTFNSDIDRGCTIRERVDAFALRGVPSKDWGQTTGGPLRSIKDEEWQLDPRAAWQ